MHMRRLIVATALVAYLVVVTLPLMLAFFSAQGVALNPRPIIDDLASALAMVGFAAILVEFCLLGRFRPLSVSLGSDVLMQSHQLLARTALLFIVIHPFLYSLWGADHVISDRTFAAALNLSGGSLLTGGVAWVLLISLVFSATKRAGPDSNYDRWRFWHAVMAVLLVAFGLHHTLAAGRYSTFTPLAHYWWPMVAIAALAVITVYLVRPILQKNAAFTVSRLRQRAPDIVELVIAPLRARRFRFKPGQFAWLKLGSTKVTHDHPFSIASSPQPSGEVHFLIKSVGDFTSAVAQTPVGTPAYLDGPHGHFQIPENAPAVVMIAGGIGVAPFCGLLQACVDQRDARPIRLIYGNRLVAQQVDVMGISGAKALADFQLVQVVGEGQPENQSITGQLDASVLAQVLQQPSIAGIRDRAVFMVCGPVAMIDAVEAALVSLGIPLGRIVSEKFQYDFNLISPRSRRNLGVWLAVSLLLLLSALLAALR